jgi:hypothetical protein
MGSETSLKPIKEKHVPRPKKGQHEMSSQEEEDHVEEKEVKDDDDPQIVFVWEAQVNNNNRRRKRPLEWQPYFIEAEGLEEADLDLKRCGICWSDFQKGDLLVDLSCCQSRKRIHQTCAAECLSHIPNTCPYCGYDNIDLLDDILTFN